MREAAATGVAPLEVVALVAIVKVHHGCVVSAVRGASGVLRRRPEPTVSTA